MVFPIHAVVAVAVGLQSASLVPAEQPDSSAAELAVAPTATTEAQWRREAIAYEWREIVESYQRHHGVELNPESRDGAFLAATAAALATGEGWGQIAQWSSRQEYRAIEDPLIWTIVRLNVTGTDGSREARDDEIRECIKRLLDAAYTPLRVGATALSLVSRAEAADDGALLSEAWGEVIDNAIVAACAGRIGTVERRYLWSKFFETPSKNWTMGYRDWFIDRTNEYEAELDPWLIEMIRGAQANKRAWDERGSKLAGKTTSEQFRRFDKHLDRARRHFLRAWQIDPACPEPAAYMIKLTMAGSGVDGETEWDWFERATAVQLDFGLAVSNIRQAEQLRWGGSIKGLERIVETLVDQRSPASDSTMLAITTLGMVASENRRQRDEEATWSSKPLLRKLIAACDDAQAARSGSDERQDYYNSAGAFIAARLGDFEIADERLRRLHNGFHSNVFEVFDIRDVDVFGEVVPMVGPTAGLARRATNAERKGKFELATKHWSEAMLIAAESGDELLDAAVRGRLRAATWQDAFNRGETVEITFDDKLSGVRTALGRWGRVSDDEIEVNPLGNDSIAYLPIEVGASYVFEGEFSMPDESGYWTCVGLVFGSGRRTLSGQYIHRNVGVWPGKEILSVSWYWTSPDFNIPLTDIPDRERYHEKIMVDGGRALVEVNGRVVYEGIMPNWSPDEEPRRSIVGFGAWKLEQGSPAKFSKLTIRKLRKGDWPGRVKLDF